MSTPTAAVPVPPARRAKGWDIALSIVLLVLAGSAFGVGAFVAVFSLAFLDYCPPETCSSDGAAAAQIGGGFVIALLALVGTVATIILLALRRRGWWVALLTLVVTILGWVGAFVLYAVAVDHP